MSGNPSFDNLIYLTESQTEENADRGRSLPEIPKQENLSYNNPVYEEGKTDIGGQLELNVYELDRASFTSDATIYADPENEKSSICTILKNRKLFMLVGLLICVVILAGAVVGVMMSTNGSSSKTDSPSVDSQSVGAISDRRFSGSMTIVKGRYSQYRTEYMDKQHTDFKSFAEDFEKMIENIYLATEAKRIFRSVSVQELRPGSVQVFYRLQHQGDRAMVEKYDSQKTKSTIMKGLVDEGIRGSFGVDLNSVQIQKGDIDPPPAPTTSNPTTSKPKPAITTQSPTTTTTVAVTTAVVTTAKPTPLFCQRPTIFNKFCQGVVEYNSTSTQPYYGVQSEEFLRRLFIHFKDHELNERCRFHIAPFLCTVVFPPCQAGHRLPPCQEYCYVMYTGCWKSLNDVMNISQCLSFGSRLQKCVDTPEIGPKCSNGQFLCRNGPLVSSLSNCISKRRVCNDHEDCLDGEDERNCTKPVKCTTREIACVNGSVIGKPGVYCIPLNMQCNGKKECSSGSDEIGCDVTCQKEEERCKHGTVTSTGSPCLPHRHICDDVRDCSDGSDEFGCLLSGCDENEFRCVSGVDKYNRSSCILVIYRCDRDKDCLDGSDEKDCPDARCPIDKFKCATGHARRPDPTHSTCIPKSGICDGKFDCQDRSDETNCTICTAGGFRCKNGTSSYLSDNQCINLGGRCDGHKDCTDGSDEMDCPKECPDKYRSCKAGYYVEPRVKCYPESYVCDRKRDCSDGSDEEDCAYTCPSDQFKCKQGVIAKTPGRGFCIRSTVKCDGVNDCADGSDETDCHVTKCGHGRFYCGSESPRKCIANMEVCDSYRDCGDGRDEAGCQNCGDNEIRCKYGYVGSNPKNRCYTHQQRCDGVRQCSEGSDEAECNQLQSPSCASEHKQDYLNFLYYIYGRFYQPFACTNGFSKQSGDKCISRRLKCDRIENCSDGSDEDGCTYSCNASQFKCLTRTLARFPWAGFCIRKDEECDGYIDCLDSSDEVDCHTKQCASRHWRCTDGARDKHNHDFCIRNSWVCDGDADCTNGSDEDPGICGETRGK